MTGLFFKSKYTSSLVFFILFFISGCSNDATDCDLLAADPDDPNKIADGVTVDDMDADKAIEACLTALEANPVDDRLQFQLGRALMAAGHSEEALPLIEKSAGMDYPAALGYMGHLQATDVAAIPYYRKAAEGDYAPAEDALAKIEGAEPDNKVVAPQQKTLDSNWVAQYDFSQPMIIKGLYTGDFRLLRPSANKVLFYINQINQSFQSACPALYDHKITTVSSNRLMYGKDGKGLERQMKNSLRSFLDAYKSGSPGEFMQKLGAPIQQQEAFTKGAQKDLMILLSNYGCDDPVKTIYKNMKFFVEHPDSSSSVVAIHRSEVMPVFWGLIGSIFDVPKRYRPMVEKQISQLMTQKQPVITCVYGPFNKEKKTGFQQYDFWYKNPPNNIYDLITSLPQSKKHPLNILGFNAVDSCPKTPELAYRTRRSGMAP